MLPVDVVIASEFKAGAAHETVAAEQVPADMLILDAGEKTVAAINAWIDRAKTLVWNGPLGAFEKEPFDRATVAAAKHAAARTREGKLLSVAGGGDTVSALNHAGVADDFSYVSTAGGAFLEWLEGQGAAGRRGAPSGLAVTHGSHHRARSRGFRGDARDAACARLRIRRSLSLRGEFQHPGRRA